MTNKAQALRDFSGPIMTSTLGLSSHLSRFLMGRGPPFLCNLVSGTSSSVPSKTHDIRTLLLTAVVPTTTASWNSPSNRALTFAPTAYAFSLLPAAPVRGLTVVPSGSQKARQPELSSMRLKFVRSGPATAATALVGTRTMEQNSPTSSGTSVASPNGPAFGTICSRVCALLLSSGSPATNACLPSTSTSASDADAILDRCFAQAPVSPPAGNATTAVLKPKRLPDCWGGKRSSKWPLILRSDAAMVWNFAAVRDRVSPKITRRL
mmetsp:Transcript_132681/g.264790  ORF Transcript_132681/g.264790 Transcript_132681/m.264790 type:complete len:265 (-) Transcript_132681:835-1629(-)